MVDRDYDGDKLSSYLLVILFHILLSLFLISLFSNLSVYLYSNLNSDVIVAVIACTDRWVCF